VYNDARSDTIERGKVDVPRRKLTLEPRDLVHTTGIDIYAFDIVVLDKGTKIEYLDSTRKNVIGYDQIGFVVATIGDNNPVPCYYVIWPHFMGWTYHTYLREI
jgi:hypothetical protein